MMIEIDDFSSLGLSEEMLAAVKEKGFERPTSIQKLTIPKLLTKQNDIIAQSQTGTGKTAAYGLPLLQTLSPAEKGVKAIVLVPTRELALQVTEEMLSYNHTRHLSITPIYGGASMTEQLRRLSKGTDIVVGTPGRVLDHIRRKTLDLSHIQFLILDEADEMLNMGFIEDVEEIISHTPEQRRVMLFSATMPQRIVKMSQTYMREVEMLKVEATQITADLTDQIYFEVREGDKFDALTRIIDITPEFYGIVFSRTKVGVDEMVARLLERGYAADGLHGDVSQAQREKTLRKFKNKHTNILVATDVAARGIDINNLSHVINYSLPQDSESYVHRIGRTGRAGNQGTAITFISPSEFRQFGFLKRDIKVDIQKKTLPTAQDVVATKRNKIKDDLQEIISGESYGDYGNMADEILALYPAEIALSALLRLAFRNELDEGSYPEIRSFSVDRKGTARLFIAVGRVDGYDARKLVALLKRECGLKDNKIDDIKLMDNYSFVSVPFADAEHVVRKLNDIRKGSRPLAEIAKPDAGGRDERPARAEWAERTPRATRAERPARAEWTERPERTPKSPKAEKAESAPKMERAPKAERPAWSPNADIKEQISHDGQDAFPEDAPRPARTTRTKSKAADKTSFDAEVFTEPRDTTGYGRFAKKETARKTTDKEGTARGAGKYAKEPWAKDAWSKDAKPKSARSKDVGAKDAKPKDAKPKDARTKDSKPKDVKSKASQTKDARATKPATRVATKKSKSDTVRGYRDFGEEFTPSPQANSGFDWSIFEQGGNVWDSDQRGKKKKK